MVGSEIQGPKDEIQNKGGVSWSKGSTSNRKLWEEAWVTSGANSCIATGQLPVHRETTWFSVSTVSHCVAGKVFHTTLTPSGEFGLSDERRELERLPVRGIWDEHARAQVSVLVPVVS